MGPSVEMAPGLFKPNFLKAIAGCTVPPPPRSKRPPLEPAARYLRRGNDPGAFRQDAPCDPVRPDLHIGRQLLDAARFRESAAGCERTAGWRLVERGRRPRYRFQPL